MSDQLRQNIAPYQNVDAAVQRAQQQNLAQAQGSDGPSELDKVDGRLQDVYSRLRETSDALSNLLERIEGPATSEFSDDPAKQPPPSPGALPTIHESISRLERIATDLYSAALRLDKFA